jgi:hypothetical protein
MGRWNRLEFYSSVKLGASNQSDYSYHVIKLFVKMEDDKLIEAGRTQHLLACLLRLLRWIIPRIKVDARILSSAIFASSIRGVVLKA